MMAAACPPLLEVVDLKLAFGGIMALDGVSFTMARGEILGLIGPNGAGKTTLFNCLSRFYRPLAGDIRFEGRSLLGEPAHGVAKRGISRTFQNLALFQRQSVLDNVKLGAHAVTRGDMLSDGLRLPWACRTAQAIDAEARTLVDRLGLVDVAERKPAGLPFGTRKRIEIARALAARPKLLLLDEPAGGLNHEEVEGLASLIRRIRDEHEVSVLLVEHHMRLVMSVSDKVVALNFGRKIAEGPPATVQADGEVIRAYLGGAGR